MCFDASSAAGLDMSRWGCEGACVRAMCGGRRGHGRAVRVACQCQREDLGLHWQGSMTLKSFAVANFQAARKRSIGLFPPKGLPESLFTTLTRSRNTRGLLSHKIKRALSSALARWPG